eukprot:30828-Pelagococcus_subviridis.AAC.1
MGRGPEPPRARRRDDDDDDGGRHDPRAAPGVERGDRGEVSRSQRGRPKRGGAADVDGYVREPRRRPRRALPVQPRRVRAEPAARGVVERDSPTARPHEAPRGDHVRPGRARAGAGRRRDAGRERAVPARRLDDARRKCGDRAARGASPRGAVRAPGAAQGDASVRVRVVRAGGREADRRERGRGDAATRVGSEGVFGEEPGGARGGGESSDVLAAVEGPEDGGRGRRARRGGPRAAHHRPAVRRVMPHRYDS